MNNFGAEPRTLHRVHAPDTSVKAAYSVDSKGDEQKVFGFYCRAYPTGLTSKDLAIRMNKPLNAFSGRISHLLEMGMIEDTGVRRDGCRVLRMKPTNGAA